MNKFKFQFEKLTPFADSNIDIYESAIDYVFSESDIRNVAISGAYGSGKSSVLESYKKKHTNLKFVHISLSHFQSNDDTEENKDIGSIKDSVLEGKILNQLIHQISAERIPQTNFRVKRPIESKKIIRMVFSVICCTLAILGIVYFDIWKNYINSLPSKYVKYFFAITTNAYSPLIFGITSCIFFSCFLFYFIKLQKTRNLLKRLNFNGNEIEIFEQTDDSYFDKYLNEVLYLFENIDADVIVFEDMDRFEANRIFERLREVNTLVNQQSNKTNKDVLRFFYLLRDDIFISKDRTKFFDYIIPVIPVMDGSNSYNQFISHLKKNNLFEKFNEHFLQGISLYVDDMRLLKNICNEFIIYYYRLNITELDYNKMLALIVYKNLFPRDFCNLQVGQGFVYALFSNKDLFIATEIQELKEKIGSIIEELDQCQQEHLETLQELEDVFSLKRGRVSSIPYSQRNAEINKLDKSYEIRKKAIENKQSDVKDRLLSQKAKLEQEIDRLGYCPLKNIISRDNIDDIFRITTQNEIGNTEEYLEIKSSNYFDLLKYLIRNGYLDESYPDYMTYFYENSLSRTDKIFLRSISDRKAREYTYPIKDPKLVLSRIHPLEFEQPETLNFDLLNHLISTTSESLKLSCMVEQLKKAANYSFVTQYFDFVTSKELFVVNFNKLWPTLFKEMMEEGYFNSVQLKEYSVLTLCHSDDRDIIQVNTENVLTNYISNDSLYLDIENPQIKKLLHAFQLLNISFCSIDPSLGNTELFCAVYRKGLYELNYDNIKLILQYQYHISNEDDILHKNYSLILTNKLSSLYHKTQENISDYIDIVLERCGNKITDDEKIICEILNCNQIDQSKKERYISYITMPITDLKMVVDKNVWKFLINSCKLEISEINIMEYFLHAQKLDSDLINFINNSVRTLEFSSITKQYTNDNLEKLFDEVVVCTELINQKYKECITSLGFRYNDFEVENITDEKMGILIDNNIIDMNETSLLFIRDNYGNVVIQYIMKHFAKYIELVDVDTFSQDELNIILDSDVEDESKLKLLKFAEDPISIVDKKFSVPICVYILKHNLDQNDMESLFIRYDTINEDIQEIVLEYAIKNVKYTADNAHNLNVKLLSHIMESRAINDEEKIMILIKAMPQLSQGTLSECFTKMGMDDYNKVFDKSLRPKYLISNTSTTLLEALKDSGWISEYLEDSERPRYYKIRRNHVKNRYWIDNRGNKLRK